MNLGESGYILFQPFLKPNMPISDFHVLTQFKKKTKKTKQPSDTVWKQRESSCVRSPKAAKSIRIISEVLISIGLVCIIQKMERTTWRLNDVKQER